MARWSRLRASYLDGLPLKPRLCRLRGAFIVHALLLALACRAGEVCRGGNCGLANDALPDSINAEVRENGSNEKGVTMSITCGWVEETTPIAVQIAPDHEPGWRAFSAVGRLIKNCTDLLQADVAAAGSVIYRVPPQGPSDHGPGLFMWPTHELGHRAVVEHVPTPVQGKKITLTTVSHEPKVFVVDNLFSLAEADDLVNFALSATAEDAMRRSSTGATGYTVDRSRTSENAWDSKSFASAAIKRRMVKLLGFPKFDEAWIDGLQTLRYKFGTAYNHHMDFLSPVNNHNTHSHKGGTNRYATLLLYLSDVDIGGETVFVRGQPVDFDEATGNVTVRHETRSGEDAVQELAALHPDLLAKKPFSDPRSWERRLLGLCRTKLAVKPKKGRAVMFYSQLVDGRPDALSDHGGCPVVSGVKWAANLWVWNGCRIGYECAPGYDPAKDPNRAKNLPVSAVIENGNVPNAQLFWEANFIQEFPPGTKVPQTTFAGHRWFVRDSSTGRFVHGPWTVPTDTDSWRPVLTVDQLACTDPVLCNKPIALPA